MTVVMVTHEQDIAAFARRNIHFRDGLVVEDHPVQKVSDAAAMLARAAAPAMGA